MASTQCLCSTSCCDSCWCAAVTAAEKTYAVLAAVLGPTLAVGAWLLITTSYRTEKRTIIAELGKRLRASDITDTSGAAGEIDEMPTEEMRKVAREIAKWCLWRWDGFLGFRAGSDRQFATLHPPPPSPTSLFQYTSPIPLALPPPPPALYWGSPPCHTPHLVLNMSARAIPNACAHVLSHSQSSSVNTKGS